MTRLDEIAVLQSTKGDYYKIKSDGKTYSAWPDSEAFEQLKKKEFKIGDMVKLDYTENPGKGRDGSQIVYKNLVKIEVSDEKPTLPPSILEDKELEDIWKASADCVVEYIQKKALKVVAEGGFGDIGPSINTLFMKKIEERRRR